MVLRNTPQPHATTWFSLGGTNTRHRGFTLVELLVVIAIISILVMLMLPAISAIREAARRTGCANNQSQLGIAMSSYEAAHEVYPPGVVDAGGPVANSRSGFKHSWTVQLLPYLDEKSTYGHIDKTKGAYHVNNLPVAKVHLSVFSCPSDRDSTNSGGEYVANYAGCHHDVEAAIDADNRGMLFLNSAVKRSDVKDGLAKTILLGEKVNDPTDLSWLSGTRATLRNTGTTIGMTGVNPPGGWVPLPPDAPDYSESFGEEPPQPVEEPREVKAGSSGPLYVGGFGSWHPGGAFFCFADGHVRFLPDVINPAVYQQLGHRADGKLMGSVDDL